MARTIAIGEQDFSRIIENNYFYIDKTTFIKEWWENGDAVTLITRPRRFGKTLTMNMLDCFFSIRHADKYSLFVNQQIWDEEKYRRLQGTYPVIFLSFADAKGIDYQTVRKKICQLIVNLYMENYFLLDSGFLADEDTAFFKRICADMDDADAARALSQLARFFYKYYGKKTIILLDEYDSPMQEAYVNGYWNELTEFIIGLFNSTFKTNPYLERAIMTGITRVSKESVFSDLNNLTIVTTASSCYETAFGFTEQEVFKALGEFGIQYKMPEVKRWYDGFRFGNCENIYNPWSIINFLKYKKLKAYWANTSSNRLIEKLIQHGDKQTKTIVEDLIKGSSFHTMLDEQIVFILHANLIFSTKPDCRAPAKYISGYKTVNSGGLQYNDLNSRRDAVWSLLLASGYLKITGYETVDPDLADEGLAYQLALTNMEIVVIFKKMIRGWFASCSSDYNDFIKALLTNDLRSMNAYMNRVALSTISFFDSGNSPSEKTEPERFYHGFVLGIMIDLDQRYSMISNRESGFGRYDVLLEPLNNEDDGIIFEFKVFHEEDGEKSLADTAAAAVRQIIDKQYAAALKSKCSTKNIRIYGFAFRGKEVLIDGGYIDLYEKTL